MSVANINHSLFFILDQGDPFLNNTRLEFCWEGNITDREIPQTLHVYRNREVDLRSCCVEMTIFESIFYNAEMLSSKEAYKQVRLQFLLIFSLKADEMLCYQLLHSSMYH